MKRLLLVLFLIPVFFLSSCQYQPHPFVVTNTIVKVEKTSFKGLPAVKILFKNAYDYPDDGFNNVGDDGWVGGTPTDSIILIKENEYEKYSALINKTVVITVQPVLIKPPVGVLLAISD